jgi:putative redox protein
MNTSNQTPTEFPGMDASLRWVGGLAFEADGMGGATLRIDQPADEGGGGLGFKPMELQLQALAACMGTTVVKILAKQRLAVDEYRIAAHGERDPEMPHPYTRIVLEHTFRGHDLKPASLQQTVALVEEKYCSIAAMLPREMLENRVTIEVAAPDARLAVAV